MHLDIFYHKKKRPKPYFQLNISLTSGCSQESQPQPPSGFWISDLRSFLLSVAGSTPIFSATSLSGTVKLVLGAPETVAETLLFFFGFSGSRLISKCAGSFVIDSFSGLYSGFCLLPIFRFCLALYGFVR